MVELLAKIAINPIRVLAFIADIKYVIHDSKPKRDKSQHLLNHKTPFLVHSQEGYHYIKIAYNIVDRKDPSMCAFIFGQMCFSTRELGSLGMKASPINTLIGGLSIT